jgi:hypothetical protein
LAELRLVISRDGHAVATVGVRVVVVDDVDRWLQAALA